MPSKMERLTAEFQEELLNAYIEAKTKYHYNATRFFQMLEEHGGVETARRLLATGTVAQTGLTELWNCQRLDLSVEAKVLIPKYALLFDEQLKDIARRRLIGHQFDVDAWLKQCSV
jgi:hypothetical protein